MSGWCYRSFTFRRKDFFFNPLICLSLHGFGRFWLNQPHFCLLGSYRGFCIVYSFSPPFSSNNSLIRSIEERDFWFGAYTVWIERVSIWFLLFSRIFCHHNLKHFRTIILWVFDFFFYAAVFLFIQETLSVKV